MVGEPRAWEGEVSGGHGGRGDGERDPFGIWKAEERRKYVSPTSGQHVDLRTMH